VDFIKKTWLLGFGFLSISLVWALYNAFIPLFLKQYISSAALIGFLMTLDNYFAFFLQPWIGNRSDRTNTKFGRRMPFLLIGMPLAAVFVALIPFHVGLITLILFMVLMNLSMSIYRAPTVALMPDITPDAKRSKANGVINFMGGFGSIIAFGIGSKLYGMNQSFPFLLASLVTLVCLLVLFKSIKEKRDTITYTVTEKHKIRFRDQLDRTTVFLLGAIFFWFVAYQGIEAFFTLYGVEHVGMSDADAAFSLTFYSLAFLVFALPSGWLGAKYGKKKIIMIGVIGLALVFALVPLMDTMWSLRGLLIVGGMFWACININSYPFVISTGKDQSIGTRTGLYYLISSLAAISSPPLMGFMIDLFGYSALFICATVGMLLALGCVLMIRNNGMSAGAKPSEFGARS
jgi:maltose/moltooligosaccharide transporter